MTYAPSDPVALFKQLGVAEVEAAIAAGEFKGTTAARARHWLTKEKVRDQRRNRFVMTALGAGGLVATMIGVLVEVMK